MGAQHAWVPCLALCALVACTGGDASPAAPVCTPDQAATCACRPELGFCTGQCVNLASHPGHCGACGHACPAGQLCSGGVCSFSCAETLCPTAAGSECVSLSDDRNHCGGCNQACPPGDRCIDAQCKLDCGALTDCSRACVDLQADNTHCGACGNVCPAGTACTNGACTCQSGLALCGDACIDTTQDPEHCGRCGAACSAGDRCDAGRCVGPDGCTDTPVAGLALRELAVFQSVKVPIMQDLAAIRPGQRNADIVQGRPAVFRVYVTPEAGWTPREVSARIELANAEEASAPELFYSLLTPASASSDEDPNRTFQVDVPAEALTADTRYTVTLVECGAGGAAGGNAQGARFPREGFADLGARETGPLRVHLIPLNVRGTMPDVSESSLELYRSRLFAMYPVTEVELTLGAPLSSSANSMCSHLAAINARRSADNPPIDLYYYGLTANLSGGQSGCSTATPNARSASKVSAGWHAVSGFDLGTDGPSTMCHELGHAHGRLHSPCGVSDPDRNYPYPSADIGVWAHDLRTGEFLSPARKDMMSYCPNDRSLAWLSDYTYQALVERVAGVNALAGAFTYRTPAPDVPWRLLVVDSAGVHWGEYPLLVQGTPEGAALPAVVHDASGPISQVVVYKQDLEDGQSRNALMLTIPEPDPSWRGIEIPGLLAYVELPRSP